MSFSTIPICPSTVDPITDIFHVVMLSAILKSSFARPFLSVSMDGAHTNVSGKYCRSRGVAVAFRINAAFCLLLNGIRDSTVETDDEAAVLRVEGSLVTVTTADVLPTCKDELSFVMPDDWTGTWVNIAFTNPGDSILTS